VDVEHVTADLRDGVLTIVLSKDDGNRAAPHPCVVTMRTRRLIAGLLLLTCGFLAGLFLDRTDPRDGDRGGACRTGGAAGSDAPSGRATFAARSVAAPDFSGIAARTVPVVANISSTQVIQRRNSPFSNDPFFRYFFGDDADLYGTRRDVERSLGPA
jgi:hypothetical protein